MRHHHKTFNTMHKFIALLLLLSLCSCIKEQDAVLKLNNKEVYFVDIPLGNTNIRSYANDLLRKKSFNVISYTLSNPTNKKLLFVIDINDFFSYYGEPVSRGILGFTIKDKNSSVVKDSPSITHFINNNHDRYHDEVVQHELELKRQRQSLLGTSESIDNYINKSVVLHPGETKTYKAIVSLPIVLELDPILRNGAAASFNTLKDGYTFQVFYQCRGNKLKESLPNYLKNELAENEIEIFDGTLYSNPAILKLKK